MLEGTESDNGVQERNRPRLRRRVSEGRVTRYSSGQGWLTEVTVDGRRRRVIDVGRTGLPFW